MQYGISQPDPKPKSRRRWIVAAIIIVVVVIIFAVFIVWATSGNDAKITQNDAKPHAQPAAFITYDGKYVNFMYKNIYQQKSNSTDGTDFEQTLFRANTSYEKTLAIEVQPTLQGGIGADGGYQYRQQHPDLYHSQQITVAGKPTTMWLKNDGSEQTIYIEHGNQYAVISFSLDRTNDNSDLSNEVNALLQSFGWK